ncbi:hypothetical protein H2201_004413 [Coniosporium apollinis]|uniref:Uncharacterized protein n=1 Tax=Coniosporium apollinis TaxID=61459 RepID=A0ABQ9NV59_9PEZI|nr:hypothetical protein H2201_004413 [Coniosporium apollinis]
MEPEFTIRKTTARNWKEKPMRLPPPYTVNDPIRKPGRFYEKDGQWWEQYDFGTLIPKSHNDDPKPTRAEIDQAKKAYNELRSKIDDAKAEIEWLRRINKIDEASAAARAEAEHNYNKQPSDFEADAVTGTIKQFGGPTPAAHELLSTSELSRIQNGPRMRLLKLCMGGRPEELYPEAWRLMELKANFNDHAWRLDHTVTEATLRNHPVNWMKKPVIWNYRLVSELAVCTTLGRLQIPHSDSELRSYNEHDPYGLDPYHYVMRAGHWYERRLIYEIQDLDADALEPEIDEIENAKKWCEYLKRTKEAMKSRIKKFEKMQMVGSVARLTLCERKTDEERKLRDQYDSDVARWESVQAGCERAYMNAWTMKCRKERYEIARRG